MVAAVNTAPSPTNTPVSALNGTADASSSTGISFNSDPSGKSNVFATLLHKQMGKQTAANEKAAVDPAQIPPSLENLETTESQAVQADLAALLPFLEAAGLVVKDGSTSDTGQLALEATEATDEQLPQAPVGAESITPAAILAPSLPAEKANEIRASAAAGDIVDAAVQANTPAPTANIADGQQSGATAASATPTDSGYGVTQDPGQSTFDAQFSAAQKSLQAQAPGVQDKASGESMTQQLPGTTTQQSNQAGIAAAAQASESFASQRGATTQALPVTAPVGTPQWSQELGDRVVWMSNRLESKAELVLNPPQMGRIEVSLSVSGDQANAIFTSTNPTVRDALEASLPRLREVLADAGIQLGQAQVGAENARQSAQQEKNGDNFASGRDPAHADATPLQPMIGGSETPLTLKAGRGLVDTFA